MSKIDFTSLNNSILQLMQTEGMNWKKPWVSGHDFSMPFNPERKQYYKGGNTAMLLFEGLAQNYPVQFWGTYLTWQRLGAQVRKGEHSSLVYFFKSGKNQTVDNGKSEEKSFFYEKTFNVFNYAQVDGYTLPEQPKPYQTQGSQIVDEIYQKLGITVIFNGVKAYYQTTSHCIGLPAQEQFTDQVSYDATRIHELIHWTKIGIERNLEYAVEELVAELGSIYMCNLLGFQDTVRPDHAQYLNAWMKHIQDNERAFVRASAMAMEAVEYIVSHCELPFEFAGKGE